MNNIVEFLFLDENRSFLVSSLIFTSLVIVEVLFMIVGASLSQLMGLGKPDFDKPDFDKPEFDKGGFSLFAWMNKGNVPFVIFFTAFLAVFALSGFILQWIIYKVFGAPLHGFVAAPVALIPTLFLVRWITVVITQLVPREFSTAVYVDSLSGNVGSVVIKTAPLVPGQAKVKDQWGTIHYVRILPEGDEAIEQGSDVVLLDQENHVFSVRKI